MQVDIVKLQASGESRMRQAQRTARRETLVLGMYQMDHGGRDEVAHSKPPEAQAIVVRRSQECQS